MTRHIKVADDASLVIPGQNLEYSLRYGCDLHEVRLLAASVVESYSSLLSCTTTKEAILRLKILRKSVKHSEQETK